MTFADTSALYALLVDSDRVHAQARAAHGRLLASRDNLWTIDPVLTELWLLLRRKADRPTCDRLLRALLGAGLQRVRLDAEDFIRTWEIGAEWPDQDFSLTDRQAFSAIERSGQLRAWSYDDDFAVIRLGPRRSLALELIR